MKLIQSRRMATKLTSPLTEGRGLKHILQREKGRHVVSPLTEGRGLKRHAAALCAGVGGVAPHGGAWIETSTPKRAGKREVGRPSRRGVD